MLKVLFSFLGLNKRLIYMKSLNKKSKSLNKLEAKEVLKV